MTAAVELLEPSKMLRQLFHSSPALTQVAPTVANFSVNIYPSPVLHVCHLLLWGPFREWGEPLSPNTQCYMANGC